MKYRTWTFALCSLLLTAIPVSAGEKEDREAIRSLFQKEQEGHRIGNAQMVRSTYWKDFYIIDVPRPNNRPYFLLSKIMSANEYFQGLGSNDEDYQGRKAFGDRLIFHSEMNHVSVNGDVAVAITQFHYQLSAEGGGRNNDGHMSLWVAEKRNGVWKWKSAQMVDRFREFIPSSPTPNSDDAE